MTCPFNIYFSLLLIYRFKINSSFSTKKIVFHLSDILRICAMMKYMKTYYQYVLLFNINIIVLLFLLSHISCRASRETYSKKIATEALVVECCYYEGVRWCMKDGKLMFFHESNYCTSFIYACIMCSVLL